jgi:hypothetical protein
MKYVWDKRLWDIPPISLNAGRSQLNHCAQRQAVIGIQRGYLQVRVCRRSAMPTLMMTAQLMVKILELPKRIFSE